MDALFNDRKAVWHVNVPNRGSLSDFPDDLVVETVGYVDRAGITPLAMGRCHATWPGWSRCSASTRR